MTNLCMLRLYVLRRLLYLEYEMYMPKDHREKGHPKIPLLLVRTEHAGTHRPRHAQNMQAHTDAGTQTYLDDTRLRLHEHEAAYRNPFTVVLCQLLGITPWGFVPSFAHLSSQGLP